MSTRETRARAELLRLCVDFVAAEVALMATLNPVEMDYALVETAWAALQGFLPGTTLKEKKNVARLLATSEVAQKYLGRSHQP